jgi:hypothetical protein
MSFLGSVVLLGTVQAVVHQLSPDTSLTPEMYERRDRSTATLSTYSFLLPAVDRPPSGDGSHIKPDTYLPHDAKASSV